MAKKRDDSGMQSKLMNAAMTAFSRKGLNDCRMSDIADAAGLARGTAYLYFKSKEQLMLSMYKLYSSIHLPVHQRTAVEAKTRPFQAVQAFELFCSPGWIAGTS
jgi:AcrR family transcriptional regulator